MGTSINLPCFIFSSKNGDNNRAYLIGFIRRRQWQPTPVVLPGESHGQRSLVGCSPWGRLKSDTTERLHFPFSLSCIGEGNLNSFQQSCLENPMDRGTWWDTVHGVARVEHNLSIKPPPYIVKIFLCIIKEKFLCIQEAI